MAVNFSPVGGVAAQFFTNSGVPLNGGKIFIYLAGTTTPATAYTTSQGDVPWTNPIVLNSAGRVPGSGEIWITDSLIYKFVLKDANDVLIGTYDNISGAFNTDSSLVTYTPAGTNAVTTTVQAKLRESVSVKDFGAVGDNVKDDTAAIQNAINAVITAGTSWARYALKPSPNDNFATVTRSVVFFPEGTYKISNALTFSSTLMFEGENSIIVQSDQTKDIFYSETPFFNRFYGLTFVGGKRQIFVQNGPTGVVGGEAVMVQISNCEFSGAEEFAVFTAPSGAGGGMYIGIDECRFLGGKQFCSLAGDNAYVTNCWIGTYASGDHPADTAMFELDTASTTFSNNLFVPGLTYNTPSDTRRWIDTNKSVFMENNRFGGESGGIPIVYSFHDQSAIDTYPYQGFQISFVNNNATYVGATNRLDFGFIVLKNGLPQSITIENNSQSVDGPYIRTNLMSGAWANLSTYLNTAFVGGNKPSAKQFTFSIKNNSRWAASITQSAADTALLRTYMESDNGSSGSKVSTFNIVESVRSTPLQLYGKAYAETSTTTGTSIIDTAIFFDTTDLGYGQSAVYELCVSGNPLNASSGNYRSTVFGYITVVTGNFTGTVKQEISFNQIYAKTVPGFADVLAVTPVFWNGTSEVTSIANGNLTNQIRLKISGYVDLVGAFQAVYLMKRI